jgi:multidrug efflux pump subunit AcrA (membrane-fusion protein)
LTPGNDPEQYIRDLLQESLQNGIDLNLNGALDNLDLSGALGNLDLSGALGDLGNLGGTITIDGSSLYSGGSSSSSSSTMMATLCKITPGKEFSMVVDIDEIDIFSIEVGQPVNIVMDAMLDEVFSGEVVKISSVGSSQGGVTTYPVTVRLDATDIPLLAGMNATANIVTEVRENVLLVPMEAIQEYGDEAYIFMLDPAKTPVLKDGKLTEEIRIVTTGISDGVNVEITSGLSEGEDIVFTVIESNVFLDAFTAMGGGDRNERQRS